jgi:hypothetical protein
MSQLSHVALMSTLQPLQHEFELSAFQFHSRGRRGRILVGITTTCSVSAYQVYINFQRKKETLSKLPKLQALYILTVLKFH